MSTVTVALLAAELQAAAPQLIVITGARASGSFAENHHVIKKKRF